MAKGWRGWKPPADDKASPARRPRAPARVPETIIVRDDDSVTLLVPIRTVSEGNVHVHWRKSAPRKKRHRETGKLVCLLSKPPPLPCIVWMWREAPQLLDDDNLRPALKALRDGIADYYGTSDRDPFIDWRYGQTQTPHYAVRLRIERRQDPT